MGFHKVQGLEFRIWGFGVQSPGGGGWDKDLEFRVHCLGFGRVWPRLSGSGALKWRI